MRISASALLRACLLASVPLTAIAQTNRSVVEAEIGHTRRKPSYCHSSAASRTSRRPQRHHGADRGPRIAHVHQVTFPAAGNYELYARYLRRARSAPTTTAGISASGFGDKSRELGANGHCRTRRTPVSPRPRATVLPTAAIRPARRCSSGSKITGSQGPATPGSCRPARSRRPSTGHRVKTACSWTSSRSAAPASATRWRNSTPAPTATGTCPPPPPPDPPPYTRTDPPIADRQGQVPRRRLEPGHRVAQLR